MYVVLRVYAERLWICLAPIQVSHPMPPHHSAAAAPTSFQVFVVDGGEWDEEISWEFDDEYDDEIALNGTAPFVTYFCSQDGKLYESDERPYHNSTWEILYGHTNDGDGCE